MSLALAALRVCVAGRLLVVGVWMTLHELIASRKSGHNVCCR